MSAGRVRIRLAYLIDAELQRLGLDPAGPVDPSSIDGVMGGERSRDQARWAVAVPMRTLNLCYRIHSWSTMSLSIKRGIKLVEETAFNPLPHTYESM